MCLPPFEFLVSQRLLFLMLYTDCDCDSSRIDFELLTVKRENVLYDKCDRMVVYRQTESHMVSMILSCQLYPSVPTCLPACLPDDVVVPFALRCCCRCTISSSSIYNCITATAIKVDVNDG